jgi:hypothetical protein
MEPRRGIDKQGRHFQAVRFYPCRLQTTDGQ